MSRIVILMLVLAAVLPGCGFDKADIEAETPPLQLGRGTTPADSTEYLFDPDGLDLIVMFKRPMDGREVTLLQLVPTPAVMGPILNPATNPRQVLLQSVVLDTIHSAYRLVLDGPTMNEPEILSYYSRQHSAFEGAMQGTVMIDRGDGRPHGVLVYALAPPGLEGDFPLHGGEATILGQPILGVTKGLVLNSSDGAWFRLAGLQLYRRYMVLAILDTNGDGEYDLTEDWWGYYRDALDDPLEVVSGVPFGSALEPPLPEMRVDVDFWMLAPGALDPQVD